MNRVGRTASFLRPAVGGVVCGGAACGGFAFGTLAIWVFACCGWGSRVLAAEGEVDYAQDVMPILRAHCYECHDGAKRTAELRLDVRAQALQGGESGQAAIVPGDVGRSALLERVRESDESLRMPPEGPGLTEAEIDILVRWIERGADWPDDLAGQEADPRRHWAFQPVVQPEPPSVQRVEWPRNAIDEFVLARLEQEMLPPSPPADPVTLIRRVSLDLIGLPPTPEEIDAFVLDNRPDAYARLVERLLRSPHYGERWGRTWLDAARYADSDGYEKDKAREVWFYRDWVIGAFNHDLPYDQFVIEQLAGDLLPDATQDQRVATGFLRNSMINEEGGIDPEQFRMTAMFDRLDAIGKSILGLTIQCAQCHNHKFDPLTQEEYYRLFAFLNNDHEANMPVYTPSQQQERAAILAEIARIEADLQHQTPDWRAQMWAWEDQLVTAQPTWHVLRPEVDEDSSGGQKYLLQEDGSFLAQGYAPTKHTVLMTVGTALQGITGVRLELLTDPNLPCRGPGRSVMGTAALTEIKLQVAPLSGNGELQSVAWANATADLNPLAKPLLPIFDDRSGRRRVTGPIGYAIDGDDSTAWSTDAGPGRRNQSRQAVFQLAEPISIEGGARLIFHLQQAHGGWNSDDNQNHNLGRFRLAITTSPQPTADPLPGPVRAALATPREERTAAQEQALFGVWRPTVAAWSAENERIEALWRRHPEPSTQLVLAARDRPRETHVLTRGDFLQPAEAIGPGTPAFLHDLPADAPPTRLTLARWLVDRQSPTVARSIVNRIWQAYFGIGLVETAEDLGTRSAEPSHPQLLDWLAAELMDQGWSLKHLHRLIVNSATYRQSSRVSESLWQRDPYNRWLARGPRFRVDAEIVRDIALSVSGLLNPAVGGPSVYPPVPEFMLQPPVSYGPKPWPESQGADRYRRAIYTFRFRSVPYPVLEIFDAPNGDVACVRRSRSNTPLQALTTLNEPLFVESAQALAARMLRESPPDPAARVTRGFRLCVGRVPDSRELAELIALYERQVAHQGQTLGEPTDAGRRSESGEAADPSLEETSQMSLAAWTTVARVLLNLDETVTKE